MEEIPSAQQIFQPGLSVPLMDVLNPVPLPSQNYDCNDSPGFFSPTTPGLSGLFNSPDLPEGAHENISPRKSRDDSFLTELLKSNNSKRHHESVQFSSQREINEWLFDTPSILKSSPPIRNEGISRRSLDQLLDPDISLSWVESMATPPSDSAEKNLTIVQEEALPEETDEKRSGMASESIKSADIEDEECHCHCDLDSVFQKKAPRKGVARVLFGAEEQEGKAADEIVDERSKNNTLNQVEDLDEDLPFSYSISSCDDDNFSLSPPVVDTQDNFSAKPINFSQSSAIFSGLKEKEISQFDDTSTFWSNSKTQNIAAGRGNTKDTSKSLLQDGNDAEIEERKSASRRPLDNTGSPLLIDMAEKENLVKDSSFIVTSPSVASKSRYHREMSDNSILHKCLDVTSASKYDDSVLSEDVTLTSSPTVVPKAGLQTGNEGRLRWCSSRIETQDRHSCKRLSVEKTGEENAGETGFIDTTLCKENKMILDKDTSFSTSISSIFKSPGAATFDLLNKQSSSSVIKDKGIYQTPDKVSILNLSAISDTTLSPTVVSSCKTRDDFTPFTSRSQYIEITESTPKISRADLCTSTTSSSSISFQDCPLSPSVVKSTLSYENYGVKAPDEATTHDNISTMKDSGQTGHNGSVSQDDLKHRNADFRSTDTIWSANASHDCHSAQKISITDNDSEDESNCLLTSNKLVKSHAPSTDLNDYFILDESGDECLLISGSLENELKSKILYLNVSCPAYQTRELNVWDDSKVKNSNSDRDEILFDSIDISGHEIKKKDSAEEVSCLADSSFGTQAEDIMSTSHGNAELSIAAIREPDTSPNGNNTSNVPVIESFLASRSASNSFSCSRTTDVGKIEEGRFHEAQSKSSNCMSSASSMTLEEVYLASNAEGNNCSLHSLNSLSLQSENTTISTEEVMCFCTFKSTKSVDFKQNKEELRSNGKLIASCPSCDRSKTHENLRISSVEESGSPLQRSLSDNQEKERRKNMCKNNIVDMDVLTEIPYDEFDKSFCYKGKLGLGNFTEQFLKDENRSSNEWGSIKAEQQDDKTDALVEKDLSCVAALNKVTLEETDSTFQKPHYNKRITKPRAVQTRNNDESEEQPDTGLNSGHARSNDNVMMMSNKQTRQLSDSSTEDMLDELMFGANGPSRKRKRLEEDAGDSAALNKVSKDKEEGFIDRGIRCKKPNPADATMGGTAVEKDQTFQGFSTGTGKNITLSVQAIEQAERMFRDTETRFPAYDIAKYPMSGDGSVQKKESFLEGFSTGSGKKITLSENAIKRAKTMFEDVDALVIDEGKTSFSSKTDFMDEKETSFKGFRTGAGKAVTTSAKAMDQAKRMFEDNESYSSVEKNCSKKCSNSSIDYMHPEETDFKGFRTGNGKAVTTSAKSMEQAKRMFKDSESSSAVKLEQSCGKKCSNSSIDSMHPEEPNFKGFCTGAGKAVTTSAKAMEQAKWMFDDINVTNVGCTLESNELERNMECKRRKYSSDDKSSIVVETSNIEEGNSKRVDEKDRNGNEEQYSARLMTSKSYKNVAVKEDGGYVSDGKGTSLSEDEKEILTDCLINNTFDIEEFTQLRDNDDDKQFKATSLDGEGATTAPPTSYCGLTDVAQRESCSVKNDSPLSQDTSSQVAVDATKDISIEKDDYHNECNNNVLHVRRTRLRANRITKKKSKCDDHSSELPTVSNKEANKDEDNRSEFPGFQTGLGKNIKISEVSLMYARNFLHEDEDILLMKSLHESCETARCTSSATVSSFLDTIKEATTNNLTNRSADSDRYGHCNSSAVMQQKDELIGDVATGLGKSVKISDKAMRCAKTPAESADISMPGNVNLLQKTTHGGEFIGFTTGTGKKVEISKNALHAAKKRLESVEITENKDFSSSNAIDDGSKFIGFSTGTGKKVEISKKALHSAKKRLESAEVTENKDFSSSNTIDDGSKFTGFTTGTGKKVEISKKALHAAKKRLESAEITENNDFSSSNTIDDGSKFTGFSTGTGKKVEISKKALHAAKKRLESAEIAENKDFSSSNAIDDGSKFVGFSTGTGKKVEISKKALYAAKKRLESAEITENKDFSSSNTIDDGSKFTGFSTGTGKKVEISKKALHAAKKRLESAEVTENKVFSSSNTIDDGSKFTGFSTGTGKKVEISKKALHAAKKRLESAEVTENKDFSSSNAIYDGSKFAGFSTGTGKKVEISKKALHAAKERLESADITEIEDFNSSNTIDDGSKFTGFSTGTGKKVEISKKALYAAKKRLESAEITENKDFSSSNAIYDGSKFAGFSTGTGKKVEISKKALHAAKERLESADITEIEDFNSSNTIDDGSKFTGFSTGTGKKVEISKKALHAAKKRLESVEDGDLDTSVCFEKLERTLADDCRWTKHASSPKQGISGVQRFDTTDGELPDFRKPNSLHTVRKTNVPVKKTADVYVEMSQRFDEDMMKTMEENPSLLDVKRNCNNSTESILAKRNEVEVEKENEVPETRINDQIYSRSKKMESEKNSSSNRGGSPLKQEHSSEKNGTVSLKRSIAGLGSKSRKFSFVATPSTPAGYQSDRIAKFTTPLVPKTAVAVEFSTPDTSKAASAPKNPLHQSSSKSTPVTSQADLRAKSFSTPFIRNNLNTTRGRLASSTGKRRSKRPLFSCVPFSNKKQKLDDDCNSNCIEESKIVRQAGRLFLMKKETQQKKRLSQCNFGQQPGCYSRGEAYNLGVSNAVIDVTSENAQGFVFNEEFFSKDTLEKGSITVGDGAVLNLTPEGCAGLEEFKRAFRSLPGVENSLFGDDWLANHYRWIIWKLASMERSFPHMFAGRCLTPNEVMYHLKYRYDKEIDAAERPALKKILERDDISSRRLVLCVSKIYSNEEQSMVESSNEKSVALDKKCSQQKRIIELTDGWYSVKAALDKPLSNFINMNRIHVGLKLCVYGAELIGSEQAVPPLEAPDSLMLVLHANSTRRVHWDAKLGFQTDRRAFPVPLYSLFPDGGLVGCIDIVILRSYPIQWMEKTENGCIFRNNAQEQKAAKKYCDQKQIRMENLYSKIQKQFENSSQPKVTRQSRRRSLNPSVKEIDSMRNGQELYDMLNTVSDPASIEMMLSDSQKDLVAQFRHRKEEEQQSLMQKKFDDAWKEIQEEFPDRCVISLQKFRVTDYKVASGKPRTDSFVTVWKPKEEMREIWKEGARLKVFNLSASASRYKHTRSNVQLATMSTTRYEELHVEYGTHYSKRMIVPFSEIRQNNKDGFNEIDVVGYVIYVEQHGSMSELETVYIADLSETFVAVKIWGGLKAFSLEETIHPGILVCIQNLVSKSESLSGDIIYATFCDLSAACRNPKESYLKKAVNDIKSEIQDVASFVQERQESLRNSLPSRSSKDLRIGSTPKPNDKYLARWNTLNSGATEKSTPTTSANRSEKTEGSLFSANPKIYTPKQCTRPGKEHLTPINLVSDENIKDSIVVNAQKKLNDMKRRALSRYGEPHTISPSAANITPKARRAFKPPSVKKT